MKADDMSDLGEPKKDELYFYLQRRQAVNLYPPSPSGRELEGGGIIPCFTLTLTLSRQGRGKMVEDRSHQL
ncbi:MAG: hypothetical protein NTW48_08105 [Chloroflexi bacterium]|nr:hypothetical protein [Chloroflexota bacterium]